MTKVLFVAAEAVPFVKTGGLADVTGSLPKTLNRHGLDVRVVLPKYKSIPARYTAAMEFVASITVYVSWRKKYCGIYRLQHENITYYFIDNEEYFGRDRLYGYWDDGERFAFFCRAVLEMLPVIDFFPQVLHCHDWHAALVNVFLRAFYKRLPEYRPIRTLFTIHNLRYQGIFPKTVLTDVLGLGWQYFQADFLEFYDQVNYMKGGIVAADLVSTVSETYAREIQYPFFGEYLDGLLRERQFDLEGIINGIDYEVYDPATDHQIFVNYDLDTLDRKRENKLQLQELLGLPVKHTTPMVAVVSRLVGPKGLDLIAHVLDELLAYEDAQFVVLGTGEEKYESLFQYAAWKYPAKLSANIFFDDKLAHQIYAGTDMFLMPSLYEPCGIGQLIALRYGTVPIVREVGGLKDTVRPFNQYTGEGNGFTFSHYNAHDMLYTIKRALGIYHDKLLWQKVMRNAMTSDFSWQHSAIQYIGLYQRLGTK